MLNGLPEIFGIEGRVNFNVNFNGLLFKKKNNEKLTKFCLHKVKKILSTFWFQNIYENGFGTKGQGLHFSRACTFEL